MVNFYVTRIKLGRINIEQVPEKWRAAVQAALEEEESEVTHNDK